MRVTKERASVGVNLSLTELVEVPEEFKNMGTAAARQSQRRAVVLEVLTKSVPVSPLLGLVAAQYRWTLWHQCLVVALGPGTATSGAATPAERGVGGCGRRRNSC